MLIHEFRLVALILISILLVFIQQAYKQETPKSKDFFEVLKEKTDASNEFAKRSAMPVAMLVILLRENNLKVIP
jgi:hypothetical protein